MFRSIALTAVLILTSITPKAAAQRFMLDNAWTKQSLYAPASTAAANGGRVCVWGNVGSGYQQWDVSAVGEGWYAITAARTGLCLDAHAADAGTNGCRVGLWEYVGGVNQQWAFVQVAAGRYAIVNRAAGLALDLRTEDGGANGGRIQLWEFAGGVNQVWTVRDLAPKPAATTTPQPGPDYQLRGQWLYTESQAQRLMAWMLANGYSEAQRQRMYDILYYQRRSAGRDFDINTSLLIKW